MEAVRRAVKAQLENIGRPQIPVVVAEASAGGELPSGELARQTGQIQPQEDWLSSSDSTNVAAAATAIANETTKIQDQQILEEASFEISALRVLTPAQVTALQGKLGSTGLVRVLGSMIGGPGMLGRMGGPGR